MTSFVWVDCNENRYSFDWALELFFSVEEKILSDHLDHLYRLVHIVNFSTSIQALTLLFQVMDTR